VVVPCSLTYNPTRTLPNQVSYLKGSSMESFTLGPTPKIDFRCSAVTTHLQWLQMKNHVSEQLWNSIPNSCSSQCPGASIYRLGAQMSVRQNIGGRRPDGGHGPPGRWTWAVRTDNCATGFSQNFAKKSFLFKSCVWTGWHIVRTVTRPLQVISL
jgi:hypothetical protein